MGVLVDASIEFPHDIEPPNMKLIVSLEVIDESGNVKVEVPPPPPPKVYDSLGDEK